MQNVCEVLIVLCFTARTAVATESRTKIAAKKTILFLAAIWALFSVATASGTVQHSTISTSHTFRIVKYSILRMCVCRRRRRPGRGRGAGGNACDGGGGVRGVSVWALCCAHPPNHLAYVTVCITRSLHRGKAHREHAHFVLQNAALLAHRMHPCAYSIFRIMMHHSLQVGQVEPG